MSIALKKSIKNYTIMSSSLKVHYALRDGVITDSDIYELLSQDPNFGLKRSADESEKSLVLRIIFNAPFVLCDQKYLSESVKALLPTFLFYRYGIELSELERQCEDGDLTEEEFDEEKALLKYCYYESTEDGKRILNTGTAKKPKPEQEKQKQKQIRCGKYRPVK